MRNKCKHKNAKYLSMALVLSGNTWEWCKDCGATKLSFWRNGKWCRQMEKSRNR